MIRKFRIVIVPHDDPKHPFRRWHYAREWYCWNKWVFDGDEGFALSIRGARNKALRVLAENDNALRAELIYAIERPDQPERVRHEPSPLEAALL